MNKAEFMTAESGDRIKTAGNIKPANALGTITGIEMNAQTRKRGRRIFYILDDYPDKRCHTYYNLKLEKATRPKKTKKWPKVLYLCDGNACPDPKSSNCGGNCFHTSNIKHATNFYKEPNTYSWFEKLPRKEGVCEDTDCIFYESGSEECEACDDKT